MGYSIEKLDINRDGNDDILVGNYRTTYLYYGGPGILDTTKDLIYKGRCLCILVKCFSGNETLDKKVEV